MARFGRRHGLNHGRGVAINKVMIDGSIRNPAARLWPQTERLKAALARLRRTGEDEERAEVAAAYAGLVKYLETPARAPGATSFWPTVRDRGARAGQFDVPITCALAELIDTAEADVAEGPRVVVR